MSRQRGARGSVGLARKTGCGRLVLDRFGIPLEVLRKAREMDHRGCGLQTRYYGVNMFRLMQMGRLFHKR
ncbi:MAG: hypothetical protein HYS56_04210 [Candidatus Omnitrophica bacterium]|nr:hypothetical protein [Candidatus Omnitrophota bacterium]